MELWEPVPVYGSETVRQTWKSCRMFVDARLIGVTDAWEAAAPGRQAVKDTASRRKITLFKKKWRTISFKLPHKLIHGLQSSQLL